MLNAACPLLKLKEGPVLVKKKKKKKDVWPSIFSTGEV